MQGLQQPTALGMAQTRYQTKADALQKNFKTQWDAIVGKSKKIGDERTRQMLNQIHKQASMEARKLTSTFNEQQQYLGEIQKMQQAGLIANGDELMWKAVMGPEVGQAVRPPKTGVWDRDKELSKIDRAQGRTDAELGQFRQASTSKHSFGRRPGKWIPTHNIERGTRLQKYAGEDDKGKELWEDATASDNAYYNELSNIYDEQQSLKEAITSGGRMSRNAARLSLRPDNHSGLREKVAGYSVMSRPEQKQPTRKEKLDEYKRLGGSQTEEGRQFATEQGLR
jgi:hypothetical protein